MSFSEEFAGGGVVDREGAMRELRLTSTQTGVWSTITEADFTLAGSLSCEIQSPVVVSIEACEATKQAIRINAEREVMQAEIVRLRAALNALEPAPTSEPEPAIFSAVRRSSQPVSLVQYGRMGVKLIP